jgi:hypothetical protein
MMIIFLLCLCLLLMIVLIAVQLEIVKRHVKVTGPRGTLTKDFRHVTCDLRNYPEERKVVLEMWFAKKKTRAHIRTVCSEIQNMITGVTKVNVVMIIKSPTTDNHSTTTNKASIASSCPTTHLVH